MTHVRLLTDRFQTKQMSKLWKKNDSTYKYLEKNELYINKKGKWVLCKLMNTYYELKYCFLQNLKSFQGISDSKFWIDITFKSNHFSLLRWGQR